MLCENKIMMKRRRRREEEEENRREEDEDLGGGPAQFLASSILRLQRAPSSHSAQVAAHPRHQESARWPVCICGGQWQRADGSRSSDTRVLSPDRGGLQGLGMTFRGLLSFDFASSCILLDGKCPR